MTTIPAYFMYNGSRIESLTIPNSVTSIGNSAPQWKDFFFINEMEVVAVTNIILNVENIELQIGETFQLSAVIEPANASIQTIIWSSSNQEVAFVSEDGLISGMSEGIATITASCGDVTKTCEVIVTNTSGFESIIDNRPDMMTVYSIGGLLLRRNFPLNELKSLSKGIYIIDTGENRYKISI